MHWRSSWRGSGWNLVIDARDGSDLESAAAAIDDAGTGDVVAIAGDVTDPQHATLLVDAAVEGGGFSLLVNNASLLGPSPQPRIGDYPLECPCRMSSRPISWRPFD